MTSLTFFLEIVVKSSAYKRAYHTLHIVLEADTQQIPFEILLAW